MGQPVPVSVVAADPMLEAGATSALRTSPEVAVVLPNEPARVAVLLVDGLGQRELGLIRSVRGSADQPDVVVVVPELAASESLRAIAAGARGLLYRREATPDRLVRAVLTVDLGDCTLPPDIFDHVVEHAASAPPAVAVPAQRAGHEGAVPLTARQTTVLELMAEGHSNGEIARMLSCSEHTVKNVIYDLMARLQVRNRAQAVARAIRAGLI